MAVPQGLFYYPGLQSLCSGHFTLSHGTHPSSATLFIAPQRGWIPKVGTLTVSFGSSAIAFPNCTVDNIEIRYDASGKETWAVHILDRRWMWKFAGAISGYYNVRRGERGFSGEGSAETGKKRKIRSVIPGTEKTPQELCRLCLDAMDEQRYDISRVPEGIYPEIEWDYTLPAEALSRLADDIGCRVILRINNTVSVERSGMGATLPLGGDVMEGGIGPNPAERPDSIIACTSRVRWQKVLPLEPVGRDLDNRIVPIDDLSYIPWQSAYNRYSWGCESEKGEKAFANVGQGWDDTALAEHARRLARECVFRWFRIIPGSRDPKTGEVTKGFNLWFPTASPPSGEFRRIMSLDRILPIEDKMIDTQQLWDNVAAEYRDEPKPAEIRGWFLRDSDTSTDEADKDRQYTGSATIDRETGIVKTGDRLFLRSSGGLLTAPKLWLRTSFSLRIEDSRGWVRAEERRRLPGAQSGALPRYIVKEDVEFNIVFGTDAKWTSNWQEVYKQLVYYLDVIEAEYQDTEPASVTYAGFKWIVPDGAIQQVTWTVAADGAAITHASRQKEEVLIAPTYGERRMLDQIQEALDEAKQTARQKKKKGEKAQA
jgi:hypothetical protein